MRNKWIAFILLCTISLGVFGCAREETESNSKSVQKEEQGASREEEKSSNSEEENESKSEENENDEFAGEKTLSEIEEFLLSKGVLSGERTKMAAEMVGAVDGFKYSVPGAEIYEYDIESEEYKKLCRGESISLKGMEGFEANAVSINGKFVLFGEAGQELVDVFSAFE